MLNALAQTNTFQLSNMAPQYPNITTEVRYHCYITVTELLTTRVVAWKSWEDYTRKKAEGKETDVYVITGSTPGAEMYAHAYRGYILIVYETILKQ